MSLHVHWAADVRSGSHRPPEEFRTDRSLLTRLTTSISSTFTTVMGSLVSSSESTPIPSPLKKGRRIPLPPVLMRKEVPFERWFAHYRVYTNPSCKSRLWAVVSATEGLFRMVWQVACVVFHTLTCNTRASALSKDIVAAQWQGVKLSVQAIFCPAATVLKVRTAEYAGRPLIGARAPVKQWRWGTSV
jgi:hypothetical protein